MTASIGPTMTASPGSTQAITDRCEVAPVQTSSEEKDQLMGGASSRRHGHPAKRGGSNSRRPCGATWKRPNQPRRRLGPGPRREHDRAPRAGAGCPGRRARTRVRSCRPLRSPAATGVLAPSDAAPTHRPGRRTRRRPGAARCAGRLTRRHRPPPPSLARICSSASAAHSAIAVNEHAPASAAHTASPKITASRWRTPRRCRGSATLASTASKPGGSSASPARSARWPIAGSIGDDDKAGMVPQQ